MRDQKLGLARYGTGSKALEGMVFFFSSLVSVSGYPKISWFGHCFGQAKKNVVNGNLENGFFFFSYFLINVYLYMCI